MQDNTVKAKQQPATLETCAPPGSTACLGAGFTRS